MTTANNTFDITGLASGTQQRYAVLATVVVNGRVVNKSNNVYDFDCGTLASHIQITEPEIVEEASAFSGVNESEEGVQADNNSENLVASTNSVEFSQ